MRKREGVGSEEVWATCKGSDRKEGTNGLAAALAPPTDLAIEAIMWCCISTLRETTRERIKGERSWELWAGRMATDSLLDVAHTRPTSLSDLPHSLGETDRSSRLVAPDLQGGTVEDRPTGQRKSGSKIGSSRKALTKQLPSPSSSLAVIASVT